MTPGDKKRRKTIKEEKDQIMFWQKKYKCNANFFYKTESNETLTPSLVDWINCFKVKNRPRSVIWSFLRYTQAMHVDLPISMTENRKAAKRL